MRRLQSKAIAVLSVAAIVVAACGSSATPPAPVDPVGGVAVAFETAKSGGVLKQYDLITCLMTGGSGNALLHMFDGFGADARAQAGVSEADLSGALKISFDDLKTTEVSRSGDTAKVHVSVKVSTELDAGKFRELIKRYLATQGAVPDDATIDAAIQSKLGGQLKTSSLIDRDVSVVQQDGKWVACGGTFGTAAGATPITATPTEAAAVTEAPTNEPPLATTTPGASGSATIPNVSGSAIAIAAGNGFACALISDGSVKCWGKNDKGQLGNNTTTDSATPVSPTGLGAGVKSISADTFGTFACAVTATGAIKCWGTGPLGNGPSSTSTTPVGVVGISSGARSVAVATTDVCAVMSNGGVKCWGQNSEGQLGNNSQVASDIPVDVAGLNSAALVAPADRYACALTATGGVKCWGSGGALGNGSTSGSKVPVDVVGLGSGVKTVATEGWGSCALTASGGVKCWGGNNTIPTDVVGLTSGVRDLFGLARLANCASSTDGRVLCWGSDPTPKDAVAQSGGAFARMVVGSDGTGRGANITCFLTNSGGVACGDQNGLTEITGLTPGSGGSTSGPTPGAATGSVAAVSGGIGTGCVLTTAGGVKCWGADPGDGTTTSATPVDVYGLTSGVAAISVGSGVTCALTSAGGVKCWGSNVNGALGNGSGTDSTIPVDVTGLSSGIKAISAGRMQICALTTLGGLKCWGDFKSTKTPVDVPGFTSGVAAVSVGGWTYILTAGGGIKRWASNQAIVDEAGFTSGFKAIDGTSTCGLLTAGGAKCWSGTPADLSGLSGNLQAISGTCVITATGGVKCWGNNLGNGTTVSSNTPVDAVGLSSGVRAISSGQDGVCAVTADYHLTCWGGARTIPALFPGL